MAQLDFSFEDLNEERSVRKRGRILDSRNDAHFRLEGMGRTHTRLQTHRPVHLRVV
jgi:hypothetical protein